MQYLFIASKNDDLDNDIFDSSDDRFYSAVNASAESISSILYDYDVTVDCNEDIIFISSKDAMPFTLEECEKLVKPAFLDKNKKVYPEFKIIKTKQI